MNRKPGFDDLYRAQKNGMSQDMPFFYVLSSAQRLKSGITGERE
ncbi:MAG: hypothetical protein ACYCZJ_03140 [Sulfuriferula sp.]